MAINARLKTDCDPNICGLQTKTFTNLDVPASLSRSSHAPRSSPGNLGKQPVMPRTTEQQSAQCDVCHDRYRN